MFNTLCHTGKEINPFVVGEHVIKARVNGNAMPFTVANNEKCSFGLFDRYDKLIGFLQRYELTHDYKSCVAINGKFDVIVNDAPEGAYIRKIESFFLTGTNQVTAVKH